MNDYITSQLKTTEKKLVLWSGGRSQNQGILGVYITSIAKAYFDEIVHKFPQSGRIFLSCDQDFGCIENAKKGLKPEVPMGLVIKCTTKFINWMKTAKSTLVTSNLDKDSLG